MKYKIKINVDVKGKIDKVSVTKKKGLQLAHAL